MQKLRIILPQTDGEPLEIEYSKPLTLNLYKKINKILAKYLKHIISLSKIDMNTISDADIEILLLAQGLLENKQDASFSLGDMCILYTQEVFEEMVKYIWEDADLSKVIWDKVDDELMLKFLNFFRNWN